MKRETDSWLPLLVLALLLVLGAAGAQAGPEDDEVILPNDFAIRFDDVEDNEDGTSTWSYEVEELERAQDLSFWQLEIPDCFEVLDAGPEPWWFEDPDPNTGLTGVKWQTGAGFEDGEFSVTVAGPYDIGTTTVAAKGPDLASGEITGPACGEDAFELNKTVSPGTAGPGDRVTYTITLTNLSGERVPELELEDELPDELFYVDDSLTADTGVAEIDDDEITWVGDLDPGETATIIFEAGVDSDADADEDIENIVVLDDPDLEATAVLNLEDGDPDDGADERITLRNGFELAFLGVEDNPDATSTWRYYVNKLADAQDLSNWVLEVPPCFDIVSASPRPWEAVYPDPNAQIGGIKWEMGAGFDEGEFTVTLEGSYRVGRAEVAAKGPDVAHGELPGPKCARAAADLSLRKAVEPAVAQPGDLLIYTIVVTNEGNDTVEDVDLVDVMPEGLRFIDGSLSSDSGRVRYDEDRDAVLWKGDLNAGESEMITFYAYILAEFPAGTVIENVVTVNDRLEARATTTIKGEEEPAWVLLVYLAADNNLDNLEEGFVRDLQAFNALERAAYENPRLDIYVLWDRGPDYEPIDDGPDEQARRYRVRPDLNPLSLADYVEGQDTWGRGEVNMGAPRTLYDFIAWARGRYSGAYEALSIIGHGGAWAPMLDPALGYLEDLPYGIVWDDSSRDYLSTAELGEALYWATDEQSNPLDVVFLEASMAASIENASEIAGSARYFVASEAAVWARFAYDEYVAATDAATTPRAFAEKIVDGYAGSLAGYPLQMGALAIDLTAIQPLVEATDALANALLAELPGIRDDVYDAYLAAQKFDSNWNMYLEAPDAYLDLYDFAFQLTQHVPATATGVHNAAQAVMDEFDPVLVAIIQRSGHPYLQPAALWNFDDAHGLSIYAPLAEDSWLRQYYRGPELAFADGSDWDTFIHDGWYAGTTPPPAPEGEVGASAAQQVGPVADQRVNILVLQRQMIFMPVIPGQSR